MSEQEETPDPPRFVTSVYLLAVMQLNALLRGKRIVFLFILLGVPLFISVVMKTESSSPEEGFAIMAPLVFLGLLLPLIGLFHGAGAIGEEVDQKTLGYILMRPIPREQVLLGKFLGAWLTTAFVLSFSAFACHFVIAWRGDMALLVDSDFWQRLAKFMVVTALGAAVYVVFSIFLSLRLKKPVFAGLIYIVIVEFILPFIPGPISNLAMSTHLQRLLPDGYMSSESVVAQEARIVLPDTDPWNSGAILFLVFGLLASYSIIRFRNYDLNYGSDDG